MDRLEILAKGGLDLDGESVRDRSIEVSIGQAEGSQTCTICQGTAKFSITAHGRILHCCGTTSCIARAMPEMEALCDAAEQRRWDLISESDQGDDSFSDDEALPQPGLRTLTPTEIRQFQSEAGLPITGKHGTPTFQAMQSAGMNVELELVTRKDGGRMRVIRTPVTPQHHKGIPILGMDDDDSV